MSLKNYFDREMRLLQEAARLFAQRYPEQAGHLNLNSLHDCDPHIERLLEGFAYVAANLHQRLDDDIPEICAILLQQLWPQLLFPFPSALIAEFAFPSSGCMAFVPKNTWIQSGPAGTEKTVCSFSTTQDLVLPPVKLIQLEVSTPNRGGTLFEFYFEKNYTVLSVENLIFYIHTDPVLSLELFWAFTGLVTDVFMISEMEKIKLGDQSFITPAYQTQCDTLMPLDNKSFYGLYLIQEYFAFREKHLFIKFKDLTGLKLFKQSSQFCLQVYTEKVFSSDMHIDKDIFKLNCIPAINLFSHTAEPLYMSDARLEYPLVLDSIRKESIVLQAVKSVTGIEKKSGLKNTYETFSGFHDQHGNKLFYQLTSRNLGMAFESYYLSFGGDSLTPSYISCDFQASNGHYPRQYLGEGMINICADKNLMLNVKNLTRPSPFLVPSSKKYNQWAFISALSFQLNTICEKNKLKALLTLFDFSQRDENSKKINAIGEINAQPYTKLYQGTLTRGIGIHLSLDENGFHHLADAYLFGCMLHQFFCLYAPINLFVETRIVNYPSQKEFVWLPQTGSQGFI